ncbi:hypothetical protein [Arthrobacter sp. SO5]|uniref:hypothetical protein n=1 Tax=Arthrobacter sp. SO5 TaxID=1897055 RepID=UPI001E3DDC79|nr:hypothetical protein [Arthrobacter sp. SO5]
MNSFVSLSFAAMFTSYFIHIHFANPGYSLEIHFVLRIRPPKFEAIFHVRVNAVENASLFSGGRSPLIGGD